MNEVRHYIRISIIGRDKPFIYDVEKDEWDRLHGYMDAIPSEDARDLAFLEFHDAVGHTIVVSVQDIAYINFLFEHGAYMPTIPDEDIEDILLIFFRGESDPYITTDLIAEEVFDISFSAQTSPEVYPFIRFTDEDGELMYVNLYHVQLIEVPTRAVEEGRQSEEEE